MYPVFLYKHRVYFMRTACSTPSIHYGKFCLLILAIALALAGRAVAGATAV